MYIGVRHFLELAKHYNFQALTARVAFDDAIHVVTGMLRWRDGREDVAFGRSKWS